MHPDGRSPFGRWFDRLDPRAAAKVTTAILRLEQGNHANAKGVGEGVHEIRIHYELGHRVYFAWDGRELVILLGGGDKRRQQGDIEQAKRCWREYGRQKKREPKRCP